MKHFLILLSDKQPQLLTVSLLQNHVLFLKQLRVTGSLPYCGPFFDNKGAMLIVKANSEQEAENMIKDDPFIKTKYYKKFIIHEFIPAGDENNWLADNHQTLNNLQVAKKLEEYKNHQDGESIPNTSYKLYKNLKNTFEIIDNQLFTYNKKCVPPTQEPEAINIHYAIKENDTVIAGICADVYVWKIMYLQLLFVNEAHRNKDLATIMLQRVENDAKTMGVTLVHTDTFDFQAKDFYLKQGYEIFGTLDDCPPGHKRYYLKKLL